MAFRRLEQLDVRGKRVLVREDLNVPMVDGAIADTARIDAALPTLRWLRERDARTIVLSHLGRPEGRINWALSLRPVAQALADRLDVRVSFAEDCIGEPAGDAVAAMADGDILLLENVRFHPEEERNDSSFARRLAELGDLYVNDAFATAHRAHASTEGVAHLLPSAAGFLMEAELNALSAIMIDPARPFVCAIGGAKIKDKIGLLQRLSELVNAFCVGGGMANTLLAAQGVNVGHSLRDDDLGPAAQILDVCAQRNVALGLPTDAVVAASLDDGAAARVVPISDVGADVIADIGPATARSYARTIKNAKTIVFNGPMGVYERSAFRAGTQVVGDAIAAATAGGATSVIGGGDAAAAAHMLGFASKATHVSTGGGATLEFLEGMTLPGVAALER
ncbi:MAG: phosphoglycerate kinase [Candidatus Eremiobacteraeota bacterium]|nr:phosphoglycerate kinase [Candidatus Eremiobacteraeota bacterium]